jgi:hypothetical protein
MSDYLVVDGWNGRQKIPVSIVSETPDSFEIKAIERVFYPAAAYSRKANQHVFPREV